MKFTGEIFLAWRYLRPKKTLISLLTYLSLLGPALGVGVLIVVISIMNGLPLGVLEKLMEVHSHISVSSKRAQYIEDPQPIINKLKEKYGFQASPITHVPLFVQYEEQNLPEIYAKGIIPNYDGKTSDLSKRIIHGKYSLQENEAIISLNIARRLGVRIGDKIFLHSLKRYSSLIVEHQKENTVKETPLDLAKEVTISGIYHFGFNEIDKRFIYLNQDTANELLDMEWGTSQSLSIQIADKAKTSEDRTFFEELFRDENPGFQATQISEELSQDPDFRDFRFTSWETQNESFNKMIKKEKSMITLVLFFIMTGAAVGIATCIFSLVLQKTREIGILKATGTSPLSIIIIFMSQGTFIGVLGSLLGFVGGLIILYFRQGIAQQLGVWKVDVHFIDNVPVLLKADDTLLILLGSLIICIISSAIPALVAASVKATTALHTDN